jgi:hypothetical protein
MQAETSSPYYVLNGCLIDHETGESLGPVPDLDPKSAESVEYVLKEIFNAETEAQAVQAKIDLIVQNLMPAKARALRRAAFLRDRFESQLIAYTIPALAAQGKGKTINTPYGTLGFRKDPSRIKVSDSEWAMKWAKEHFPSAVVVEEKFLVSMVDKDTLAVIKAKIEAGTATDLQKKAFEVAPESETFNIKTGVK